MKLITAIINSKDINNVCKKLTSAGFAFTKMATTGGFLKSNNVTLLIGVEDDKVDTVLKVMRDNSKQRMVPAPAGLGLDTWNCTPPYIADVLVGGATVFITNVERFEKF